MPIRKASAEWKGTLREGSGLMKLGSGAFEGRYTFGSRFEEEKGTNPEELIGAAQAGCFSMFLSALMTKAGYKPTRISTSATVHLGDGPTVTLIELDTEAVVPGLKDADFQEFALSAKRDCPISKALSGPQLKLVARLIQ